MKLFNYVEIYIVICQRLMKQILVGYIKKYKDHFKFG